MPIRYPYKGEGSQGFERLAGASAPPELVALFRAMLRIRRIEEAIESRYHQDQMKTPIHLVIGQEASAVGCCAALRPSDLVYSSHRTHGAYLAKGGDLKRMLSEMHCRSNGCVASRGGSMHLIDKSVGMAGTSAIVGGVVPIAVGAALAAQMKRDDRVVVVFIGDATTEEGVMAESLNFAALKKVPIVFFCENNFYSVQSPLSTRQPARDIRAWAGAHGMQAISVDGVNVLAVREAVLKAAGNARAGDGPTFIEVPVYRFRAHGGAGDDSKTGYRDEAERAAWEAVDPLVLFRSYLTKRSVLDDSSIERMESEIGAEIADAFEHALSSAHPTEEDSTATYTPIREGRRMPWDEGLVNSLVYDRPDPAEGRILSYVSAVNEALTLALDNDPSVFVLGQGVDDPTAMFGTTKGLQQKFGPGRVFDTPLSEEGMMGVSTGAAMNGMRPVFMHNRPDFVLLAFNQLVTHAAKFHFMDNGQTTVPMVVWAAIGRGWGSGAQHSQAIHGMLLGVPGLKIVMPSTPYDAKGLLLSAILDNNPVCLFEHRWLMKKDGVVPDGFYRVPIGKGVHRRRGSDVTLVGASHAIELGMQAANQLAGEGIETDVIDLRTIKPLDEEIVLESLHKTGRLVVVDTAWMKGGLCAEIGCLAAEKGFHDLKAPVVRVGLPDVPTPAGYTLEQFYYPDAARIGDAIRRLVRS